MSTKNEIITNIVNETNDKTNAKTNAKTTSVTPRNLITSQSYYLSSDSEDEEATWKQQMLDYYGPVAGPDRISRTPFINIKELQE